MSDEAARNPEEARADANVDARPEPRQAGASAGVDAERAGADRRDAGARSGEVATLKLRRLKIHKWRSVLPGTDLTFGDGIHALLGKNGTGKTTLLRLISMCVRADFRGLESESFDIEYELEWRPYRISLRIRNESAETVRTDHPLSSLVARDRVGGTVAPSSYRFSVLFAGGVVEPIRIEGDPQGFTVNGAPVPPQQGESLFSPHLLLLVAAVAAAHLVGRDLHPFLEAGFHAREMSAFRFDEADGLLLALEGTKSEGPDAVPPLEAMVVHSSPRKTLGQWIPAGLGPVLERQDVSRPVPRTEIVVDHTSLPLLQRYAVLAGFRGVWIVLSFRGKTKMAEDADGYLFGNARFFVEHPNGDIFSEEHLSFGQRRLLAFLYYAACNPDVLIADELTNGLHHEWIAACVDELAKRQSFVATQNPLLLDYLPVDFAKDAETTFIQCRLVEEDGKQAMHWRNTSPDEAERFWKSYESGVQFISEILRAEGLW